MKTAHFLSSISLISLWLATSCSQPSIEHSGTSKSAPTETSNTDKDVDYLTNLGLMKGHLMVAKELIDAGKIKDAEPHIGHPIEELYGDIESQLAERNVPEFKVTLNQFHDLVKSAPKSLQIKTNYQNSLQAIDTAIAAIPDQERQSPEQVLSVIKRLLDTAQEEYEAAITDGKITEAIEYQDSRGFILYSDQLYQTIAPIMSQKDSNTHQTITDTLTQLKIAWPSVVPPNKAIMTPEQVTELVTKIQAVTVHQ